MDLVHLLKYNEDTNNKIIDRLLEYEVYDEIFDSLISHVLNAQEIWNSRILVKSSRYEVWQTHPRTSLKQINVEVHQRTHEILNTIDHQQVIHYTNSKGVSFSSKMEDVVFHIINHANYHRAQINMKLRENRIEPVITDYIFYMRDVE